MSFGSAQVFYRPSSFIVVIENDFIVQISVRHPVSYTTTLVPLRRSPMLLHSNGTKHVLHDARDVVRIRRYMVIERIVQLRT